MTMEPITDAAQAAANPADPYERPGQTFPRLTEEQVERAETSGPWRRRRPERSSRPRRPQRRLLRRPRRHIEIFDGPSDRSVVLALLSSDSSPASSTCSTTAQILVSGRARGDTRIVRVRHDDFRRLVTAEPEIAEIVMRAFILRRVGLIKHARRRRPHRFGTRRRYAAPAAVPDAQCLSASPLRHRAGADADHFLAHFG